MDYAHNLDWYNTDDFCVWCGNLWSGESPKDPGYVEWTCDDCGCYANQYNNGPKELIKEGDPDLRSVECILD